MIDSDEKEVGPPTADAEKTRRNRREFLKKAAKAATVAPAVTLLISAGIKPAQATHSGSY
jgi:hypothetical protein